MILPYIPFPPKFGGAIRIHAIIKYLEQNHDLTIITFADEGDILALKEEFPKLSDKIHCVSKPVRNVLSKFLVISAFFKGNSHWREVTNSRLMQNCIDRVLGQNDFDIIQFEFPIMAMFRFNTKAKKILDAHNVEYDNFRRMSKLNWSLYRKLYYLREYHTFYKEEIEVWRNQDAVLVTSERDKKLINEKVSTVPQYVVPNGVDCNYFYPSEQSTEPNTLVFTGRIDYTPNCDGMIYFITDILPIIRESVPDIKLYIVGKNPPNQLQKYAEENIIITGFVDDVRPYVWKSSVYVVPLRMGGGTRLKVLEALAMKKPLVTTSIGSEGINVEHGKSVMIADDPKTFAEYVVQLLQNRSLCIELGQNGYQLIKSKYDWNVIGETLDSVYSSFDWEEVGKRSLEGKMS